MYSTDSKLTVDININLKILKKSHKKEFCVRNAMSHDSVLGTLFIVSHSVA